MTEDVVVAGVVPHHSVADQLAPIGDTDRAEDSAVCVGARTKEIVAIFGEVRMDKFSCLRRK